MSLNEPTGPGSIIKFIKIHCKICTKISTAAFAFSHKCVLACNFTWYQTEEFSGVYHHITFERNWPLNIQTQANIKGFSFSEIISLGFTPFCRVPLQSSPLIGYAKVSMRFIKTRSLNGIPQKINPNQLKTS